MRAARSAVLALALLCSWAVAGARSVGAASGQPYDVYVITSLTGQGAFIGKSVHDVFSALQEALNKKDGIAGRPLHFVFMDDQTNPQISVQIEADVIKKNVPFLLGPSIVGTCRATATFVTNGPVEYCLSPGLFPGKGSYVFSVSVTEADLIDTIMRNMHARGFDRIARLSTTDATGQTADEAFGKYLPDFKGMTVVADEHYAPADVSVAAQMTRILAAKPQALIIWATGTPFGTAIRAYRDAGGDIPVYMDNANLSTAQLKQYGDLLPAEVYSISTPDIIRVAKSPASRGPLQFYLDP